MDEFNKETIDAFDAEVVEALRPVMEGHGLTVEVEGGRFGPERYFSTLAFKVDDAERRLWNRLAPQLGLTSEDFGARFEENGQQFEIEGLTPGRSRYPIAAHEVTTGKAFKFEARFVLRALGREPAVANA